MFFCQKPQRTFDTDEKVARPLPPPLRSQQMSNFDLKQNLHPVAIMQVPVTLIRASKNSCMWPGLPATIFAASRHRRSAAALAQIDPSQEHCTIANQSDRTATPKISGKEQRAPRKEAYRSQFAFSAHGTCVGGACGSVQRFSRPPFLNFEISNLCPTR